MIDPQKKSDGKGHQPKEIKRENNGPGYKPNGGYNEQVGGYAAPFPVIDADYYEEPAYTSKRGGYNNKQHYIRENETLAGIARNYNISLEELLQLNDWKLVDSSKGILSLGGAEFQIQPGWYVRVPAQKQEEKVPYALPLSADAEDRIYHVQKGDSFQTIADFYHLTIEQLLYYNDLRQDKESGEIYSIRGNPFRLAPGVRLLIPAPNKNISPQVADKLSKEAAKKAADTENNHMEVFFREILAASENYLDTREGSMLAYTLGVNIPVSAAVFLTLGGKFEQKRETSDVVSHKFKASIGMKVDIDNVVSSSVDFSVFLQASGDDVEKSVELFSYGFYKFARQAADTLNDRDQMCSSVGTTAFPSAGMYYGLNFMYSDKEEFDDKVNDIEGTERKMAELEKDLFGYEDENGNKPFDQDNKNKVGFGGSIKGSAEAGNDAIGAKAGVSAEIALENTVSADTLNKTGIYGRQDEDGFLEDYEVGSKSTLTVKYGGEVEVMGTGASYSSAISFDRYDKDDSGLKSSEYKEEENVSDWKFNEMVTKASVRIAGLSSSEDVAGTIRHNVRALTEELTDKYNSGKENSRKFDPKAEIKPVEQGVVGENVENSLTVDNLVLSVEGPENTSGKTTDAVKAELKIVQIKDETTPKITLTIYREKEKSVNFGVGKAEVVNLEVIKTFNLYP